MTIHKTTFLSLLLFASWLGCDDNDDLARDLYDLAIPLGLDLADARIPQDNPLTADKIKLGRRLFFEKKLSFDGTVSCATCHNPLLGFADGKTVAVGVENLTGPRNTPTIVNRLFSQTQFWDGRAKSLEEQVLGPIENPLEMKNALPNVEKTLKASGEYSGDFQRVFGTDVTIGGLAKAIAAFERTLFSGNSKFDQFKGGDRKALSPSALRGFVLFQSERVDCVACHSGANFADEKFQNNGLGMDNPEPDLGRFTVTENDSDRGKFKTPTLRDIARTGPYMHNGSLRTLTDVVEFYNKGGVPNPNLSKHVRPLNLTEQEKGDLVEFLRSLSGTNVMTFSEMQMFGKN